MDQLIIIPKPIKIYLIFFIQTALTTTYCLLYEKYFPQMPVPVTTQRVSPNFLQSWRGAGGIYPSQFQYANLIVR